MSYLPLTARAHLGTTLGRPVHGCRCRRSPSRTISRLSRGLLLLLIVLLLVVLLLIALLLIVLLLIVLLLVVLLLILLLLVVLLLVVLLLILLLLLCWWLLLLFSALHAPSSATWRPLSAPRRSWVRLWMGGG